jgi:hypothetical protein
VPQDPAAPSRPDRPEEARALEHGSSGSTADLAVEGRPNLDDRFMDVPYARPCEPIGDGEVIDQLAEKKAVVGDDQEALTDEGVEESFPASDPPSFQPRRT